MNKKKLAIYIILCAGSFYFCGCKTEAVMLKEQTKGTAEVIPEAKELSRPDTASVAEKKWTSR